MDTRDDVTSTRPAPSRTRRNVRLAVGGSALLVGVLGWPAPAGAHVTITASTTVAGAFAVLTVSVGHGCEDSPTTEITISMPPEINAVTPTRTALWEVDKQVERLDPPVKDGHGNEIDERVASVTYRTDTPLPDGYRDTFELSVQLPDEEGATLVFPTIQTCEQGESAWIEVAQDGSAPDDLELPAPAFVISAAEEDGTDGTVGTTDGTDEGTDGLTIAALGAGLLGSALGGAGLARQRRRT